jgi:putative sterol carrier protein
MPVENVSQFFTELVPKRIEKDPQAAASIDAIYQFNVTGDDGGSWTMDFTKPEVREGEDSDAQCTVTVETEDFLGMLNNTLNPVQAFMMGKIQVEGDMALAMKLQEILDTEA